MLRVCLRAAGTAVVALLGSAGCSGLHSGGYSDSGAILVVGDYGVPDDAGRSVSRAMQSFARETPVAAIVTTGDNLYPSADPMLDFDPFVWAREWSIPVWITWGNHDIENPSRISRLQRFGAGRGPGVYEWNGIRLLLLDSTQPTRDSQTRFVEEELVEFGTIPHVVVQHHPVYNCGFHSREADVVIPEWTASLLSSPPLVVIAGHDHNYQRFDVQGVPHVVSGGGGAPLYEVSECPIDSPRLVASSESHHFLALDVRGGRLYVTAYDVNGNVMDEVSTLLATG